MMKGDKQKWKEHLEHVREKRLPKLALKYKVMGRRDVERTKRSGRILRDEYLETEQTNA